MIKFKNLIVVFILCFIPYILLAETSLKYDTVKIEVNRDTTIVVNTLIEGEAKKLYGDYIDGKRQGGLTGDGKYNDNFKNYVLKSDPGVIIDAPAVKESISIRIKYSELPDDHPTEKLFHYSNEGSPNLQSGLLLVLIKKKYLENPNVPVYPVESVDPVEPVEPAEPIEPVKPVVIDKVYNFFLDTKNVTNIIIFILLIIIILLVVEIVFFVILKNKICKINKKQKSLEDIQSDMIKINKPKIIEHPSLSPSVKYMTKEEVIFIFNDLFSQYKPTLDKLLETIHVEKSSEDEMKSDFTKDTLMPNSVEKEDLSSYSDTKENLVSDEVNYNPSDRSFSIEKNEMSIFKIYYCNGDYFYTLVDKEEIRKELIGILSSYSGCIEADLKNKNPQKVVPVKDGRLRKDGNKFYVVTSELLKVELV